MYSDSPQPTVTISGHPIHAMLSHFPIACFTGALVTDVAYWATTNIIWETFSVWLLAAGLFMAGLAVIAGLIDFLSNGPTRRLGPAWPHVIGNVIVLALSLVNAFVHSRDGYTAVVPTGLALSAVVVAIMLVTAWLGKEIVYRQRAGGTY